MPFYDFMCKRGHVATQRQAMDVKSVSCRCGLPAKRMISIPSIRVEAAEIPFEETKYYVESKKKNWDYDSTMETVIREKEKARG